MQHHQQQNQQDVFALFEEQCWDSSVDSILQTLESQQSLLTGMFRDFVQEAQLSKSAGLAAAAAVMSQHPRHSASSPPQQHQQPPQRAMKRSRATEMPLNVTLEELYTGAVKRIQIEVRRHDAGTGTPVTAMQQLQVCVQPGLHAGTRITLPGLGNQDSCGEQGDLTFVVQQQLHPAFRRLADDLYAIVDVPLVTALTGGHVELRTLSGELLQLPLADNTIITPNTELIIRNQGMPVFGDATGKRGALHVRFRVCFPSHLTQQQQTLLRQALTGDGQQQLHLQRGPAAGAGAAVGVAAGLLPKPQAGLPLLPAAGGEQHLGQGDCRHQQCAEEHQQAHSWGPWPTGAGSWQRGGAAAGSAGSSSTNWAASAGAGRGSASSLAAVAVASAGAAACSIASSSSVAGFAVCMQSTGSSREAQSL